MANNRCKIKHFLFDIEMFGHVNVNGVMSGALTTGDKLTGGTSGATGIWKFINRGFSNCHEFSNDVLWYVLVIHSQMVNKWQSQVLLVWLILNNSYCKEHYFNNFWIIYDQTATKR